MLKTVLRNVMHRARTRAVTDLPPSPPTLRGVIRHDATRCTGCGTCAFVCASKAIALDYRDKASVAWRFFVGQCAFCGLCEQYCPTQAISNPGTVPVVGGDQAAYRFESIMAYQPCPRCGKPHIPLPERKMAELMNGQLTETAEAEKGFCSDCRRKMTGERIRDAFLGTAHRENVDADQ